MWQPRTESRIGFSNQILRCFKCLSYIRQPSSLFRCIRTAKLKCEEIERDIKSLRSTLFGSDGKIGKRAELEKLIEEIDVYSWTFKTRYDADFQEAFRGLRNSKVSFRNRLLEEACINTAKLHTRDELKRRAATVFASTPTKQALIQTPKLNTLIEQENAPILSKVVIGRNDVNIAALIQKLGNADWVKEGRKYFDHNPGTCPFCQQGTNHDFAKSLDEYFDEQYLADIAEIDLLLRRYEQISTDVLGFLDNLIEAAPTYLSLDKISADTERLRAAIQGNQSILQSKRKEPSRVTKLETASGPLADIVATIQEANRSISLHNDKIDNLERERKALTDEVWRLILDEAKVGLEQFQKSRDALEKAISGLETGIAKKGDELAEKRRELASLETKVTSVQPTVDAINCILKSFGFSNFKLAVAEDRANCYRVVRPNGDDVGATLSEGERTFIAFLYFYYMVWGGTSAGNVTSSRVVVIDDPISSLDSEVLFVVSSLVKKIIVECRNPQSPIKQVFILTHNIYFHKESSYDSKRSNGCLKDESFWIIRKQNNISQATRYDSNPIKTSYELLWSELKDGTRSNLTIQNVLRRILEYYFTILGNRDKDSVIECFEGEDQLICRSLYSWINEGSHFASDDLFVSGDEHTTDKYLSVFRRIFEKTNQEGHYHMMMGTSPDESIEVAQPTDNQPIDIGPTNFMAEVSGEPIDLRGLTSKSDNEATVAKESLIQQ